MRDYALRTSVFRFTLRLLLLTAIAAPALAQTASDVPLPTPYRSSQDRQPPVPNPINPLAARYIEGLRPRQNQDFAELYIYHDANLALPATTAGRVVFLGDSITDQWPLATWFPGKPYVNRGIAAQITAQMILRFHQDVVDLHPAAVIVLAGTNDIANQMQITTPEIVENNYRALAEMAAANHIPILFSSVLPTHSYTPEAVNTTKERRPDEIRELNTWLKAYCAEHHLIYVDYTPALSDAQGFMRRELSRDGLHPNDAGYALMAPIAAKAIAEALRR